ncbi:hypothetical protein EET67_13865 [Pseudaminobacter arsenicus]|uniref:Uncharacterized protein n=1 Tax=Borborobacter arsenicus TaxID=1851146 RepID=A0A432V507_9HYPH|nr:hypothetical protein [Pseudaminobacter arsenicus]RUM97232.1 hypothetical protein EET67_13865 [Pseudaminobacter arsenicus]
MRMLLAGAALLAVATAASAAEMRYDVKLEKAVMEIVAARIGDIRGGFSHGVKPAFVTLQASNDRGAIFLESARAELIRSFGDGLVPTVERNVSRVIVF